MAVWSDDFTAAFFVSFVVTVFVPDSAVAAQLCPLQNAYRGPSMVISKKMFRHYGTSRGQMAFTTKYPNFCFFHFTTFSSICRHNFDRADARKSSVPSGICLVEKGDAS